MWNSNSHSKYLLQYHLIFVCKHRKKLFLFKNISEDVKQFSYEICLKHNVHIKYMETDKDHIHYMIETEPTISISDLVRTIKSYITHHIWKLHKSCLSKQFWKENTFFTDGYFVCSVGNISDKQLRIYIKNQG